MSSVHYSTFQHLDGIVNYVMYPLGLLTLFLGAFILVKPSTVKHSAVGCCLGDPEEHDLLEELLDDHTTVPRNDEVADYTDRLLHDD